MSFNRKNSNVYIVGLNPTVDQVVEINRFESGKHLRGREIARFPAGKGMNMSRALSVIGHENSLVGFAGKFEKDWFESVNMGEHCGEIRKYLTEFEGHTRHAVTLIDESAGCETHVVTENPSVKTDDIERLIDGYREVLHTDRPESETYICFCGRLPTGFGLEAFKRMIEIGLEVGAKVGVDASGETLRCAAEYPLWLLKPNEAELGELVGRELAGEQEVVEAMMGLSDRLEHVVVTRGRDGAVGRDQYGAWGVRMGVCEGDVVSTVGCGDCFYAGFLGGWLESAETAHRLPLAMRYGVATATANTRCHAIADFARGEVDEILDGVGLYPMDLGK